MGGPLIPSPSSRGQSATAPPWSHSPGRFVTLWARHRQQRRSSAGGDGILASARNGVRDWLAIAPLPSRPASDPTLITLVKGTYSGEIESQSRPGNRVSRPRNAISRELTSLVDVLVRLSTVSTAARCYVREELSGNAAILMPC